MSKNRYGRIYHSDNSFINLRFKSLDARRVFEAKFAEYHAGHDHDGEPPRFQEATAAEIGNMDINRVHDVDTVTIDGFATYEIEAYHEDDGVSRTYRYQPPTCCVAPIISVKRKFVESDTLKRHELSAIFGDMPDEDYQHLLDSVKEEGFIDPIIRLLGKEVLDGWHRYRAGKELNLLRKLIFRQWDTQKEGDPAAFAFARNIERRHLTPGQRAQIVVTFNERFGMGRPKIEKSPSNDGLKSGEGTPNEEPKTREQLAKQAGVGVATIDRAVAVEKEGKSEAVIAGEETAGEVLKARDAATAKKRKKKVLKNLWDARVQAARDYTGDSDNEMNLTLSLPDLEKGFVKNNEAYAEAFVSGMKRIDAATSFEDFQERGFAVDEHGNAKVNISDLEAEYKAIHTYGADLRQWDRPDWTPDRNWILPLIEAKKKAAAKPETPKPEPAPEPTPEQETVKSLWAKIEPLISEWKSNRKDKGVGRASKTMLLSAAKRFLDIPKDAETDVELLKQLLDILAEVHGPGYTFERYVKMQCDGASIWNEEKPEPDEETGELDEVASEVSPQPSGCEDTFARNSDTSLAEIENLPAVKHFLESLHKQVGTFIHQTEKDDLSCAIYDVFLSDGDKYITERQQLAVLIDIALTLVTESM